MSALDLIAALQARAALPPEEKATIERLLDDVARMEDPAAAMHRFDEFAAAAEAALTEAPMLMIHVRLRL